MKPAKDLHLPASMMPATPCLVKDNIHSLSLFCPNYYVITFSSRFGELLQKMQLSFPMNPDLCFEDIYKHDKETRLDHLSCYTQSKLSKILSLPHEVYLVSLLMASLIDFHLYRKDKDTRAYREMLNIFLTIHSRLPTQGGGAWSGGCGIKLPYALIHNTSLIKSWSGKKMNKQKNPTLHFN